ncbi:MAG: polysaccharide deacetylase family protein [Cytophagaceae bacterium]
MNFKNADWLFSLLYPSLCWKVNTSGKKLFLTFDDGPVPGITEYVLAELQKYQVKATFFCVGDNILKYPDIFCNIIEQGHRVGNHTFNHLNGWRTLNSVYLDNVLRCQQEIDKYSTSSSGKDLFRPPYGKIKYSQISKLQESFDIIMWNVLTGDYDPELPWEKCLHHSIAKTVPGSIIIFHDNIKAAQNIKSVLPRYIEHFLKKGYSFHSL